eukprot:9197329-Pyramimonas_sp.AAC.1
MDRPPRQVLREQAQVRRREARAHEEHDAVGPQPLQQAQLPRERLRELPALHHLVLPQPLAPRAAAGALPVRPVLLVRPAVRRGPLGQPELHLPRRRAVPGLAADSALALASKPGAPSGRFRGPLLLPVGGGLDALHRHLAAAPLGAEHLAVVALVDAAQQRHLVHGRHPPALRRLRVAQVRLDGVRQVARAAPRAARRQRHSARRRGHHSACRRRRHYGSPVVARDSPGLPFLRRSGLAVQRGVRRGGAVHFLGHRRPPPLRRRRARQSRTSTFGHFLRVT